MTQDELNCQVARATGETITTVEQLGFVPLRPICFEREPLVVDWDELDAQRDVVFPVSRVVSSPLRGGRVA